MTENEAISMLEQGDKNANEADCTYEEYLEAIEMGRKALEEIQQYRAIGTVEEIQQKLKNMSLVIDTDRDLLNRYIAIGTIEEFKALKEKSVAKKPLDGGEVLREVCPTCGRFISEMNSPWYCPCGQKLDWSE